GFRQTSLSYSRPERVAGASKFSFWQLWNFALTGLTGYSTIPLRAWTYLGLAVAAASFLYALYLTVRTLLIGVDVPGYTSIMVAILFFSGVQLIGIGVLGEYIGRIHMETKKRPLYVIDEALGLAQMSTDHGEPR
ncbi:MAG: glycosyltransferase, partial [Pseudomonadota bacterium]|nr:glycosyltransferase [Pseudomonadota bacterium]